MGLFIWDPLSNILSSPRLFINRYPFKTVYKPVKSIHKSWKTRNKSLRTVNNLRQLEPHRPVQKEPSKIHDESKAKHVSIKCNSGDSILLNRTLFYHILICQQYFLQPRINKTLSTLFSFQTERTQQRQLWIKGRSCSCRMASNMGCVRALLYNALKKQRVEMTAAERNSVLTFRLVRTA